MDWGKNIQYRKMLNLGIVNEQLAAWKMREIFSHHWLKCILEPQNNPFLPAFWNSFVSTGVMQIFFFWKLKTKCINCILTSATVDMEIHIIFRIFCSLISHDAKYLMPLNMTHKYHYSSVLSSSLWLLYFASKDILTGFIVKYNMLLNFVCIFVLYVIYGSLEQFRCPNDQIALLFLII